jgi:hypothetical protein
MLHFSATNYAFFRYDVSGNEKLDQEELANLILAMV